MLNFKIRRTKYVIVNIFSDFFTDFSIYFIKYSCLAGISILQKKKQVVLNYVIELFMSFHISQKKDFKLVALAEN